MCEQQRSLRMTAGERKDGIERTTHVSRMSREPSGDLLAEDLGIERTHCNRRGLAEERRRRLVKRSRIMPG